MTGLFRVFVLPDSKHRPMKLTQSTIGVYVPLDVRCEFLFPPVSVCSRSGSVFGAHVPETSIDEDGDLMTWENDVGTAPLEHRIVDSIAEAASMEPTSNCHLGGGVA